MDDNFVVLMNDTHVPANGSTPSSIDLAICDSTLSLQYTQKTAYPIKKMKYKFHKLEFFRDTFDKLICKKIPLYKTVQEHYNAFINTLNTAIQHQV